MLKIMVSFGPSGWIMFGMKIVHMLLILINEHTFIVWDANDKSDTWKVYYVDDKALECGIFISLKVGFNIIFSLFFYKSFTNIIFLLL